MVGQQQAHLVLGLPERVITAADRAPVLLLLKRRVPPRPEEVGPDRPGEVELQGTQVLRRARRWGHVGVIPERATGEQPDRAVIGRRVALGYERRAGAAVEGPAGAELPHLLEVLEGRVANRRGR